MKRNLVCENLSICQTVSNMVQTARSGYRQPGLGPAARWADRASPLCPVGPLGPPSSGAQIGVQLSFPPKMGPGCSLMTLATEAGWGPSSWELAACVRSGRAGEGIF